MNPFECAHVAAHAFGESKYVGRVDFPAERGRRVEENAPTAERFRIARRHVDHAAGACRRKYRLQAERFQKLFEDVRELVAGDFGAIVELLTEPQTLNAGHVRRETRDEKDETKAHANRSERDEEKQTMLTASRELYQEAESSAARQSKRRAAARETKALTVKPLL